MGRQPDSRVPRLPHAGCVVLAEHLASAASFTSEGAAASHLPGPRGAGRGDHAWPAGRWGWGGAGLRTHCLLWPLSKSVTNWLQV